VRERKKKSFHFSSTLPLLYNTPNVFPSLFSSTFDTSGGDSGARGFSLGRADAAPLQNLVPQLSPI
jgi:hypothetical protein